MMWKSPLPLALLLLCLATTTLAQQQQEGEQQQQQQQQQQEEEQQQQQQHVPTPMQNPFLLRRESLQRQQRERLALQKIQQGQLHIQPLSPHGRGGGKRGSEDSPGQSAVTRSPSDGQPVSTSAFPDPPGATPAPTSRASQGGWENDQDNKGANNRNEMHGGRQPGGAQGGRGPAPTPWTRWTQRPQQRDDNPWDGYKLDSVSQARCGGRSFSSRDHICCQNTLHRRQGMRPACCGIQTFDLVFHQCCQGRLVPRTKNGGASC